MTSTNPVPPSEAATVRFATEEDVTLIHTLIHELAAYENATSSVLATPSTLRATLSLGATPSSASPCASPGYARTLLIFPPASASASASPPSDPTDRCAGFALFYHSYSTWRAAPGIYLEDLFVRPAHRGRGYGTRLLRELARETRRIGGARLEWSVLKWNEPSLGFYEGLGARRLDGWVGMRVDGEEGRLEALAGEALGIEGV